MYQTATHDHVYQIPLLASPCLHCSSLTFPKLVGIAHILHQPRRHYVTAFLNVLWIMMVNIDKRLELVPLDQTLWPLFRLHNLEANTVGTRPWYGHATSCLISLVKPAIAWSDFTI